MRRWISTRCWTAEAFPNAVILLSTRDVDGWWKSASRTIFETMRRPPGPETPPGFREMITATLGRFTPDFLDESAAKAAFLRHEADVRRRAPANRLVEWTARDGWGPLCAALGVPVPSQPFPVTNTEQEFRARSGFDA